MPASALCRFSVVWRVLAAVFLGANAMADDDSAWFIRAWQTDDGLPNNKVGAVTQTRDGYLWLVLPHDLVRFDGVRFTRYPLADSSGAGESGLLRILARRDGGLWLEPHGNVFGLDEQFSRISLPSTLSARPAAMAEGLDGSLWLAYPGTVYQVKDSHSRQFANDDGVPEDPVNDLVVDGSGNVWLAKGKKICLFDDYRFRQLTAFGKNVNLHLAPTRTNGVWISADSDLYRCRADGTLTRVGSLPPDPSHPITVRVLLEDRRGNVWIGTDGEGLYRFDGSAFEKIGPIYPYITSLTEDDQGNIWAGTAGGGLNRVSLTGIRLHGLEHGMSPIESVCEDEQGTYWAATQNRQLYCQVDGKWSPAPTNLNLPKAVTCVAAGKNGGLWLGTPDAGIYFFHTNELKSWSVKTGRIIDILPDSHGDVWIIEYGSLIHRLHDGTFDTVRLPTGARPTAVTEDAGGTIWFGTDRGRLFRIDGDQTVDESTNLPAGGQPICCLYSTPDDSLWIGFGGRGLVRRKNDNFAQITIDAGLPDDYIAQIVSDNEGWLWFATDHGVFKARLEELEQVIAGTIDHVRPVIYGRNEGLISLEALFSTANPFVLPNAFRARDGRIWLLTGTGTVVADPRILHTPSQPPNVLVTRVSVDSQTVATYGNTVRHAVNLAAQQHPVSLPPEHRKLEIEFTALDFSAPENVRFRYRLDGLDDDWVDAETRTATFTRLPAGTYRFHVEASHDAAAWNQAGAPLAIIVTPFFWQTWWFESVAVIFFTATVILAVRYVSFRRLRRKLQHAEQQAALEKERSRIARDIHDDLGSSLTQIALLSGLTARDRSHPDKVTEHAQQISTAARRVTDALDEIVWAVNPRNDTLPHLVNYLGEYAAEFLRTAGIKYQIDLPAHPPETFVSTEARHNLFLVVKEALNNIARHARAGEASLRVAIDDHVMQIVIQDNGRGFEPAPDDGQADGLLNMPQRMSEVGGQFQIETGPGGTRICLVFPLTGSKLK